jgi:hypothetical protein
MSLNNRYTIINNFGEDYIEEPSSNDLRYQCPHCLKIGKRTDDYKLFVSYENLVFHCFRCGWKGKLQGEEFYQETTNHKLYRAVSKYKKTHESVEDDNLDVVFKIPSIVPSKLDPSVQYLEKRGVSYEEILKYNMRVASIDDPSRFFGRIVIPNKVVADKWTDMYVARAYINIEPKYLNPKDSPRARILFNLHNIPDNPEIIIINEGVLTSIIAGPDSVATYGKSVTDEQISLIVSKNPKKIYVSLDNDTDTSSGQTKDPTQYKIDEVIKKLLLNSNAEIYYLRMPKGKDAVDMGRQAYREFLFKNALRIHNYTQYKIYTSTIQEKHNDLI